MNNEEMLKIILYQTLSNRFYITSIFKYLMGEDSDRLISMINESVDHTWNRLQEEWKNDEVSTNQSDKQEL